MDLPVNKISFSQDTKERKQWFTAASFSHPAKMTLPLQIYLIEHYTKVGETILDPMAGSGTLLVACALGRHCVLVELEDKFVKMQKANWEKIRSLGPMLGCKIGEATILQGDARALPELLVDKCIFSPPYAEAHSQNIGGVEKDHPQLRKGSYLKTDNPEQIGNLSYGKISAVISSPPYAGTEAQISADKFTNPAEFAKVSSQRFREGKKKGHFASKEAILRSMKNRQKGCGDNPDNISKLPYADAVITSPPYEGTISQGGNTEAHKAKYGYQGENIGYAKPHPSIDRLRKHGRTDDGAGGPYGRSLGHPYSGAAENIGNLKSDNYLEAMLLVYQNCHRVLKDGGLLCLVVKNFIRDKKIVRLDLDTIKLCEQAGFVLKERLKRKLTQQSFWRIIYQQKYPNAPKIEYEDVLIFEKSSSGFWRLGK